MQQNKPNIEVRFIALMALMMSMVALGIDVMLPALHKIGEAVQVTNPNDNQLIISVMFLGLSIGQLFFGPISDTIGRRRSVFAGFFVFAAGCLLSIIAKDLLIMLVGRFLQGLGLAAFRVVCVAIVRDQYAGNHMARVVSFIMTIFILVPTVAPLIGQQILNISTWVAIFYFLFLSGLIMIIWFTIQQKETLAVENRIPLTFKNVRIALIEIFSNRISFGYTLIAGLFSGAFLGFLNTSQQVFQFQYELGELFPYYFAAVALTMGLASIVNGRLVLKYDMHRIAWVAIVVVVFISGIAAVLNLFLMPEPSLTQYLLFLLPNVFFVGLLFGNVNSIAMNPLGKIAGIGASVIGSLSTFIMVFVGSVVGRFYDNNTLPIIIGFALCAALSLLIALFARSSVRALPLQED